MSGSHLAAGETIVADEAAPMTHAEIVKTLIGLLTGMFVAILSGTVVTNALPTIVGDLGGSQSAYAGIVTATLLALTVSTPIWGKLSDIFSRKLLIQTALLVYVAGSLISATTTSVLVLIVGRALQGAGAGGTLALTQIIIAAMIPARERGRYTGYVGAVFAVATISGPLIGGVIVDTSWLGWRYCFILPVFIAAISVAAIQRTLHLPDARREVVLDFAGAALIVLSFGTLLLWISLAGNQFAWGSGWTCALVSAFVVLLGVAIRVETRAVDPVVPLRMFANRTVSLATLASAMAGVAMFVATIYLSQYFQLARGHSPAVAGLMGVPLVLGLALASLVAGRFITRTGRWKIWLTGGILTATIGITGLGVIRADTPYVWLVVLLALVGAGLGAAAQNLILAVQNTVDPGDLGAATATVSFFRSLGGAIGVSALGAVLGAQVKDRIASGLATLPPGSGDDLGTDVPNVRTLAPAVRSVVEDAYARGIAEVFLLTAPLMVIGFVCVLAIKEVKLRTGLAPDATTEEAIYVVEVAEASGGQARLPRETAVARGTGGTVEARPDRARG